jgi:hypothetical protein
MIPIYHRWDHAHAAGLRTKTQWRQEGYLLKPGAQPRAMFRGRDADYSLYGRDEVNIMAGVDPAWLAIRF